MGEVIQQFTNMPPEVADLPDELCIGVYKNARLIQEVASKISRLKELEMTVLCSIAQGQSLAALSKSYTPPVREATLSECAHRALRKLQIQRTDIPYAALLHHFIDPRPFDGERPTLSPSHRVHFYLGIIGVNHADVAAALDLTGNQVNKIRKEACQQFGVTTLRQAVHPAFASGYFQPAN